MNNKKNNTQKSRVKLGLTLCTMILALLASSFVREKEREARVMGLLDELGVTPREAEEHVWKSVSSKYLSYAGKIQVLRNYSASQRAEAAKELLQFTRSYVESSAFATRYEAYRKEHAPKAPATADEELKNMAAVAKMGLADTEKALTGATGETKKMLEESVDAFKEQIRMYTDPKHPDHKTYRSMMETNYTYGKQRYQEEMVKYEKEFPAQPAKYVKVKLQEFLTLSASVDFGAELKDGPHGKKYFSNPAYEKKPDAWKKCFRAGKEPVAAARAFVAAWTNEIK